MTMSNPGTGAATDQTGSWARPHWRGWSITPLPPLTLAVALFLLMTGRWGSYISLPGFPLYIGDIGLALALVQICVALTMGRTRLSRLAWSPLLLLLVMTYLAYAVIRLGVGGDYSLIALRDAAPYIYAGVALLAFLLPSHSQPGLRPAIYSCFVLHLAWVALRWMPGYPWELPVLGTDAMIFVIRPDFDATVLGIGAALALRDALLAERHSPERNLLLAFAAISVLAMLSISTRAGLLASLVAIVAVLAAWMGNRLKAQGYGLPRWTPQRGLLAVVLAALAFGAALTPAGSRLLGSFGIGSEAAGAAAGTVNARWVVWSRVAAYVFAQPERTGAGVGFGPDFLTDAGASAALEGIYQNVRSPHNYLVGTMARLGVGGAALAVVIIVVGFVVAVRALSRRDTGAATVLAALVAIAIPTASLFGVILESPFGAIPYFWALGQLAATFSLRPTGESTEAAHHAPD